MIVKLWPGRNDEIKSNLAKRIAHGAGLGLALAVRIAQLHHTTLSYRSQPDQGTSVILVLQKETDDEEETD